MEPIQPLWDVIPGTRTALPQTPQGNGASFMSIFQSSIDAVRETDQEEAKLEYLLSTGQLDNPALLTIAAAKADSAVTLLIQLRNRAVEAYNEVMHISL